MSASSSNPFVLPGLVQSGESLANPLLASMEMMRQAFAGAATSANPMGGSGVGMSVPMNPEDLERRITELKTVENWLKLNLSMLGSTIQGMEVQLATIATLRSFVSAATAGSSSDTSGASTNSAVDAMLGIKPQSRTTPPPEKNEEKQEASTANETKTSATQTTPAAAQAWWNMLQQQFGNVAAATAATLASSASKVTPPASKKTASKRTAKPAAKPAIKRAPKKPG